MGFNSGFKGLTYPLREDVKEPSDIFLGANVMKLSYEKPHEANKSRTHLMWVVEWSIRDVRFKCLLSFVLRWNGNRNRAAKTAQSHIHPPGFAPLDL